MTTPRRNLSAAQVEPLATARDYRVRILISLVEVCQKLERSQRQANTRRACREVGAKLRMLLAEEMATPSNSKR